MATKATKATMAKQYCNNGTNCQYQSSTCRRIHCDPIRKNPKFDSWVKQYNRTWPQLGENSSELSDEEKAKRMRDMNKARYDAFQEEKAKKHDAWTARMAKRQEAWQKQKDLEESVAKEEAEEEKTAEEKDVLEEEDDAEKEDDAEEDEEHQHKERHIAYLKKVFIPELAKSYVQLEYLSKYLTDAELHELFLAQNGEEINQMLLEVARRAIADWWSAQKNVKSQY